VERRPSLEPWLVRTGRSLARRSRFGGGLYWFVQESLVTRLRRRGIRYRDVQIRSIPMQVDVPDPTGRYPFFYSNPYKKAVTDAIIMALKPGDVFLDVGAHIGHFSILGARRVGASGRVMAFEPHEWARAALRAWPSATALSRLSRWSRSRSRSARRTSRSIRRTSPRRTRRSSRSGRRCGTSPPFIRPRWSTRIRGSLAGRASGPCGAGARHQDRHEGAEGRALAGMAQTLRPLGMTVICETTIGRDTDVALGRAGYQRHRIERGRQPFGNFRYVRPGVIGL
jgi:hypothetical protein